MRVVDAIIARASDLIPQLQHNQLIVKHPGDDDGIWYFTVQGVDNEVQLESSTGQCPFMIENDNSDERFEANNVDAAVGKLLKLFGRGIGKVSRGVAKTRRKEGGRNGLEPKRRNA